MILRLEIPMRPTVTDLPVRVSNEERTVYILMRKSLVVEALKKKEIPIKKIVYVRAEIEKGVLKVENEYLGIIW